MDWRVDFELQRIKGVDDYIDVARKVACIVHKNEKVDIAFRRCVSPRPRPVQDGASVSIAERFAQPPGNLATKEFQVHRLRVYGAGPNIGGFSDYA